MGSLKSLDGMVGVPEHHRNHRHIRRFFSGLAKRVVVYDDRVVLMVFNKADPCQSSIVVEPYTRVPGRLATLRGLPNA